MPAISSSFSSFIPNYRRKPKQQSQTREPSSPHPYASKDRVVHISDSIGTVSSNYSVSEDYQPLQPNRLNDSPQMHLDLNVDDEQLTDWIPAHLLSSPSAAYGGIASSPRHDPGPSTTTALPYDSADDDDVYDVSEEDEEDEEDEDEETNEEEQEEFIANLESLDASNFVNSPPHLHKALPRVPPKKAPAPIKIPNGKMHRPKVQLIRSSVTSTSPRSRPDSQLSFEDSAISGTTLARALLGNSFVLSNDKRASKYRSGTSTLTRSDSATLPQGEHPFLNSPYIRGERTLSVSSDMFSPGSKRSSNIPPVPPVPILYAPPQRTSSREHMVISAVESRHLSLGTALSGAEVDLVSALMSPNGDADAQSVEIEFQPTRVSRISEASSVPPTPEPTALVTIHDDTTHDNSRSKDSLVLPHDQHPDPQSANDLLSPPFTNPWPTSEPTSSAPSSAKDLVDMLDYYSLGEGSPKSVSNPQYIDPLSANPPTTGFQPGISPIPEESASMLSSPSSFQRDSWQRQNSSGGKAILVTSPSADGIGRIEYARTSRIDPLSKRSNLLPIGERPPSVSYLNGPNAGPSTISALAGLDDTDALAPPSLSNIFARQRSGSAPSPIKVVRDTQDFNYYSITVTPRPESAGSSPATEGGHDYVTQMFPETPDAMSPMWTAGSGTSPSGLQRQHSMVMPSLPMTAGLPGKGINPPSLAQQVLLNRAVTSVRPNHSRQMSSGRIRNTVQPTAIPEVEHDETETPTVAVTDDNAEETTPGTPSSLDYDDLHEVQIITIAARRPNVPAATETTEQTDSPSAYSAQLTPPPPTEINVSEPTPIESAGPLGSTSNSSQLSLSKDLPQLPLPSPMPSRLPYIPPPPPTMAPLPPSLHSNSSHSLLDPPNASTHSLHRIPTPAITPTTPEPVPSSPSDQGSIVQAAPVFTPVSALPPSPRSAPSFEQLDGYDNQDMPHSPFGRTFAPPPAYEAVIYEQFDPINGTGTPGSGPSTAGPVFSPGYSPNPSSPAMSMREISRQPSGSRRARVRPPLPAGPRRPSHQLDHSRGRNASITSLGTNNPQPLSRSQLNHDLPSPRFITPAPKWRGHPMDAAKWKFTSAELQGIVSRAIRQSSEASSIRLLRLETIDNEIPDEVSRLEMERSEITSSYRRLCRTRNEMIGTLSLLATSSQDFGATLTLLEELKSVSLQLDRLAQELHSADEQLAQLRSLREVHSSSALAMALRKLNASFLKQVAESQSLREQVTSLEAERDEAWQQAESIANEFDNLHERVGPAESQYSKRSSRVLASRKSSLRVSKAGLRSARSSISSHRMSTSTLPSGARSAFSIEDIPPVPPIPQRRPDNIFTDLPLRSSTGLGSMDGTPSSETRAMVRAHEELCEMLGISATDIRARRTRSVIGRRQDSDSAVPLSIYSIDSRSGFNGRPTSLPHSSHLFDSHAADRHAMLATIGILSE